MSALQPIQYRRFARLAEEFAEAAKRYPQLEVHLVEDLSWVANCMNGPNGHTDREFEELAARAGGLVLTLPDEYLRSVLSMNREATDYVVLWVHLVVKLTGGWVDHETLAHAGVRVSDDILGIMNDFYQQSLQTIELLLGMSHAELIKAGGQTHPQFTTITSAGSASTNASVGPTTSTPPSDEKPLTPQQRGELKKTKASLDPHDKFIGESDAVLRMFEKLDELINRPEVHAIVLLGEKGCGKTFLAEIIHEAWGGTGGPFGRCSAADFVGGDFNMAKGKLVGHGSGHGIHGIDKKGQDGLLGQYTGGTLFIDEFLDLPPDAQLLLHTVLDGNPLQKIGSGQLDPPYPQLVLAANKDPNELIQKGALRADFWDRVSAYVVQIPALRGRREDVFAFVLKRCKNPSLRTLLALLRYDWPGNVRELTQKLDEIFQKNKNRAESAVQQLVAPISSMSDEDVEKEVLRLAVALLKGRGMQPRRKGMGLNSAVASMLGRSPAWVSERFKRYGIS